MVQPTETIPLRPSDSLPAKDEVILTPEVLRAVDRAARRYGGRDREDLFQEAIVRILVLLHQQKYDPKRGSITSWAVGVTRFVAAERLRRRAAEIAVEDTDGLDPAAFSTGATSTAEERAAVKQVLLRVDHDRLQLLVRHYLEGLSDREIAEQSPRPISEAAIKRRRHRATASAKALLALLLFGGIAIAYAASRSFSARAPVVSAPQGPSIGLTAAPPLSFAPPLPSIATPLTSASTSASTSNAPPTLPPTTSSATPTTTASAPVAKRWLNAGWAGTREEASHLCSKHKARLPSERELLGAPLLGLEPSDNYVWVSDSEDGAVAIAGGSGGSGASVLCVR